MSKRKNRSGAGCVATIIAGLIVTLIGGLAVWYFTSPGISPLLPPTSTPPGAPEIPEDGRFIFEQRVMALELSPGQSETIAGRDIFFVPATYTSSGCMDFIVFTWQVISPYPDGSNLEVRTYVPMAGGTTQVVGSGARGEITVEACDDVFFENHDVVDYTVQIRYGLGLMAHSE